MRENISSTTVSDGMRERLNTVLAPEGMKRVDLAGVHLVIFYGKHPPGGIYIHLYDIKHALTTKLASDTFEELV